MPITLEQLLLVFFGAGFGGLGRFLYGRLAGGIWGYDFPFGTMGVNILGGFFIGIAASLVLKQAQNAHFTQHFVIIGILGGFTTFSAFSLEMVRMIERGAFGQAVFYMLASALFSILAVFGGIFTANLLR